MTKYEINKKSTHGRGGAESAVLLIIVPNKPNCHQVAKLVARFNSKPPYKSIVTNNGEFGNWQVRVVHMLRTTNTDVSAVIIF